MMKWLPAIALGIIFVVMMVLNWWAVAYLALALGLGWAVFRIVTPKYRLLAGQFAFVLLITIIGSGLLQAYWMRGVALHGQGPAVIGRAARTPNQLAVVAFVAALAVSVPLVLGLRWLVLWVSAEYVLRLPEALQVTRQQAMEYLWNLVLQRVKASITVDQGRVVAESPSDLPSHVGGQGKIVVRPMNAVLLEDAPKKPKAKGAGDQQKVERFVGPGSSPLQHFERILRIISLQPCHAEATFRNVLTRDRVPLSFVARVTYQIESVADVNARSQLIQARPAIGGSYSVYHDTLRLVADKMPEPEGWDGKVLAALEVALRDAIEQRLLDDFLSDAQPAPAADLAHEIANEFSARASRLGWAIPATQALVAALEDAVASVIQGRRLEAFFTSQKPSLLAVLSSEIRNSLAQEAQGWGLAIRSVELVKMSLPQDVRQAVIDLWRQRQETKIAVEGMRGETEALHRWSAGVSEALAKEGDTRRALLKDILDLLEQYRVDANAEVVAQRFMDFLTRESAVSTSPGLRQEALLKEKKRDQDKGQGPPGGGPPGQTKP